MIQLHYGSGARDFEIVGPTELPQGKLAEIISAVYRLLKARGWTEASKAIQSFEWELGDATNVFGDQFLVLHTTIPIEKYVEVADKYAEPKSRIAFTTVANAFNELGYYVRFIAIFPSTDQALAVVPPPTPKITSSTVEEALKDAQNLLQTSGAKNAVDRIHTAIHGYLKQICDESSIVYPADANLTQLFGLIRDNHPKLASARSGDTDSLRILRSFAGILEATNNLRNQRTLAHPNHALLEEPEAILAINAVRTILHYLDAKLKS
jgi:hypothetical protein